MNQGLISAALRVDIGPGGTKEEKATDDLLLAFIGYSHQMIYCRSRDNWKGDTNIEYVDQARPGIITLETRDKTEVLGLFDPSVDVAEQTWLVVADWYHDHQEDFC